MASARLICSKLPGARSFGRRAFLWRGRSAPTLRPRVQCQPGPPDDPSLRAGPPIANIGVAGCKLIERIFDERGEEGGHAHSAGRGLYRRQTAARRAAGAAHRGRAARDLCRALYWGSEDDYGAGVFTRAEFAGLAARLGGSQASSTVNAQ